MAVVGPQCLIQDRNLFLFHMLGSVGSSPQGHQGPALVGGPTLCIPWCSLVFSCAFWLPVSQGQGQERGLCHFSCSTGENLLTWLYLLPRRWAGMASCWMATFLVNGVCCRGRLREQTWGEGIRVTQR